MPPAYEPRRIPAAVGFEIPVPPLPAVNAVAKVSAPFAANDEVAVAPKDAVFELWLVVKRLVPVAFVKVSPPLKARSVEVAALGKRYAKFA